MKDIYTLSKFPHFGGGGSSGGGGGSSGRTDYPDYMKTWHHQALSASGTDSLDLSITDAMNAAFGNSPFTSVQAYNPDAEVASMLSASADLDALVDLLSQGTGLDELVTNILDTQRIDDAVQAFNVDLTERLNTEIIPKFEAGMRDIGAVVSSAFPIGKALLFDDVVRQTAKFSADLRAQAFSDSALQVIQLKLQYQYQLSALAIEANRMKIVAKKEQVDTTIKLSESDALWDLEVFKYGGNLLGSIAGSAVSTGDNRWDARPAGGSVIGGALSGAAAGAFVGSKIGGVGAVPGAIIGGVLGAASSFLRF